MHLKDVKFIQRLYIFLAIGIFTAVVGVALKFVLFLLFFDAEILLFGQTAYATAFSFLSVAFVLFCFATAFVFGKKRSISEKKLRENLLINSICCFFIISTVIMQILYIVSNLDLGQYSGAYQLLALVFAIPAGLYFFYPVVYDNVNTVVRTILGFALIFWSLFLLVNIISYLGMPLASPLRVGAIFSLTSIMLFFVFEVRMHISRQASGMLFASGLAVVFFAATNSVPQIILAVFRQLELSKTTIYNAVMLAIAIYAVARMLTTIRQIIPTENNHNDKAKDDIFSSPAYNESQVHRAKFDVNLHDITPPAQIIDQIIHVDSHHGQQLGSVPEQNTAIDENDDTNLDSSEIIEHIDITSTEDSVAGSDDNIIATTDTDPDDRLTEWYNRLWEQTSSPSLAYSNLDVGMIEDATDMSKTTVFVPISQSKHHNDQQIDEQELAEQADPRRPRPSRSPKIK